ncbi:spore coat protein GerQ [Sutcliffiella horikoshii]|uniref:spore coat protein GerQ n=1 Tax=Sutcliffiella horikoshii TaxID=79883 RepID=UPI000AA57446|nr:spore coat protein GerQ [Sutcliffiella horikoshii]MCM3618042.1 spore coat protein GerQ [Sutcliffiella horikoshii]
MNHQFTQAAGAPYTAGYGADPYSSYYRNFGQQWQGGGGFPMQQMQQQPQQQVAGQSGIPSFPTQAGGQQAGQDVPGMLPLEQSYIENILRLNRGKLATVYMTFENNREWNAKIFKGIIEAAGRDHIILSDPQTGKRYLLLMVYLDYITFDEELDYDYPFGGGQGLSQFQPR